MSKRASEPCPKCGSESVDLVNRKSALNGALGTTAIGLLLAVVYLPVLILVVPGAIYLFVTALRAKPTYTCLQCRHRWPAAESEAQK